MKLLRIRFAVSLVFAVIALSSCKHDEEPKSPKSIDGNYFVENIKCSDNEIQQKIDSLDGLRELLNYRPMITIEKSATVMRLAVLPNVYSKNPAYKSIKDLSDKTLGSVQLPINYDANSGTLFSAGISVLTEMPLLKHLSLLGTISSSSAGLSFNRTFTIKEMKQLQILIQDAHSQSDVALSVFVRSLNRLIAKDRDVTFSFQMVKAKPEAVNIVFDPPLSIPLNLEVVKFDLSSASNPNEIAMLNPMVGGGAITYNPQAMDGKIKLAAGPRMIVLKVSIAKDVVAEISPTLLFSAFPVLRDKLPLKFLGYPILIRLGKMDFQHMAIKLNLSLAQEKTLLMILDHLRSMTIKEGDANSSEVMGMILLGNLLRYNLSRQVEFDLVITPQLAQ